MIKEQSFTKLIKDWPYFLLMLLVSLSPLLVFIYLVDYKEGQGAEYIKLAGESTAVIYAPMISLFTLWYLKKQNTISKETHELTQHQFVQTDIELKLANIEGSVKELSKRLKQLPSPSDNFATYEEFIQKTIKINPDLSFGEGLTENELLSLQIECERILPIWSIIEVICHEFRCKAESNTVKPSIRSVYATTVQHSRLILFSHVDVETLYSLDKLWYQQNSDNSEEFRSLYYRLKTKTSVELCD
ncbi:hypothetical protein C5F64_13135 [Photobacterium damselae subsp. damselae]|uniref:hypothetical protein n=1 Tax=Photobacterium damselae TaxID=38293 RepID=UPI000D053D72|nr:hypothetical protein [Photobacterium damselae]PSB84589.1 hypothetical protein C5F64_13135 [Photobacterium damselae subsp. damselae]